MRDLEFFYLPGNFRQKSGNRMSNVYEVGTFRAIPPDALDKELVSGHNIKMRRASRAEIEWAVNRLDKILNRKEVAL